MRYMNREMPTTIMDDEVMVRFNLVAGTSTVRYQRNGDPGLPGDPPEVELLSVMLNGVDVLSLLLKSQREDLEVAVMEFMADAYAEEMS